MSILALPQPYAWIDQEGGPKMLMEMRKLYGIKETPGAGDNPIIMAWATEIGVANVYKHDETAWCGLSMGVVAKRAEKEVVKDPLWALNWANFGVPVKVPMLGDVMIFKRFDANGKLIGGHVTLYVGEDKAGYFHGFGGNQSDMIGFARINKNRLHAVRRAKYNVQPANVRQVILTATGTITTNEA
jgi:uncharacterized protein (TIGR02594 family)